MLTNFLLRQWQWVVGILMATLMFFGAKSSGASKEREKRKDTTLERVKERQDVKDHTSKLTDDDLDRVLRNKRWFRK